MAIPSKILSYYLGFQPTGDLGAWTFYKPTGRATVAFPRMPETKRLSGRQSINQGRFAAAARSWNDQTQETQAAWEAATRLAKLKCTGSGLYFSWYITQNDAPIRTIERITNLPLLEITER